MGTMTARTMYTISIDQRKSWKKEERISDRENRKMRAEVQGVFREQQ